MSVGEQVAKAWEEAVRNMGNPLEFEWPPKPQPMPSAEELAVRQREWDEWEAERRAKREAKKAKFLGTVVAVEDGDGDILVYSDGRRLRIISEWYEWE